MIPEKLKEGDTISVIAPSNYVEADDKIFLEKTEKLFNKYKINTIYEKHIFKYFGIWSNSIRES